ncbi:protein of unknown function (plasmid) [Magnetospirillum sp. XM-1]|nr:protein of unknown function [Magnetospirillum sp. XM-1]
MSRGTATCWWTAVGCSSTRTSLRFPSPKPSNSTGSKRRSIRTEQVALAFDAGRSGRAPEKGSGREGPKGPRSGAESASRSARKEKQDGHQGNRGRRLERHAQGVVQHA